MDGGMNGRMSQPINKIDFFPIAVSSHGFISESLLLGLVLQTEGKGCSRGEVQGLWSQMDLGSNPGSAKTSHLAC